MHRRILIFLVTLLGAFALARPALARLRVVASTPDLATVAAAVGGDHVVVTALALHTQDPHWVDARPHLTLELAEADLLLLTGADLEVGWLPTLLTGSRNGDIQQGAAGYLDCSTLVSLREVPAGKVTRAEGDVHPRGNPHYMLDPRSVERVAVGIGKRLAQLDAAHEQAYLDNARRFLKDLRAARKRWEKKLAAHRGEKIVAYHRSMAYLAAWLGLRVVEHLEPKPGIPPNPRHVARVVSTAKRDHVHVVLQESWHPDTSSSVVAEKCGARVVEIPGMPDFPGGQSYVAFMDVVVRRLADGFGR
jgi:zinc/manganese transport system substrate-binding protein